MSIRFFALLLLFPAIFAQQAGVPTQDARAEAAAHLRAMIEASPKLPFTATDFVVQPSNTDWESGMVSWVALDAKGTIYLLQRGEKADPVLVVNREGKILRSWGKGLYKIPHSIRLDPQGNVWTVDAASSTVIEFSPQGEKLMQIDAGGQPQNSRGQFVGTTDIAFGPNGRIFISDGYGNARILSTPPTASAFANGAAPEPAQDNSICRTQSSSTRTTSSTSPIAKVAASSALISTGSFSANFQISAAHIL